MKHKFLAGLTGLALAVGGANAAHAAPTSFTDGDELTLGGWSWSFGGGLDEIEIDGTPTAPDYFVGDTLDEGSFFIFDDINDDWSTRLNCEDGGGGASYDTDAATGDIVLSCATFAGGPDGVLTLQASLRIFGGEFGGRLGRVTYLVVNTSSNPVDYSWRLFHEFGECDNGVGSTGGDNDATLEVSDFWATCNSDGADEAPIALAWGSSGGIDMVESMSGTMVDDEITVWSDADQGTEVTILGNDAREYAFYYLVDDFGSADPSYTALNAEFNSLAACLFDDGVSSRLLDGLLDTPSNWGSRASEPDCTTASLADTGADVNSLVGFGAFAMIAGVVLVTLRRRSSAS